MDQAPRVNSDAAEKIFAALRASNWISYIITAIIHAAALFHIVLTENGRFGQLLALAAWLALNCLWLLIFRRPAVAAALSLVIVELLILVSAFKFKITWMTASFMDVMIIDPDSVAFLLSAVPGLRMWVICAGLFCVVLLCLIWILDKVRIRRSFAAAGAGVSLAIVWSLSNAVPEQPWEPFQGTNHVSGFTRSMAVSLTEFADGGFLEIARAVAKRLPLAPADTDCTAANGTLPKRPHIIMVLDESSFDIRQAPGMNVPADYGRHFQSIDGQTRRLITEATGGPTWFTEYNVLTGLSARSYGRMKFHVTRIAAGRVERGLPQSLRRCGYKTFTLYPAYGAFLSARRFQKTTGIERMIDAREMLAGDVEPDSFYYKQATSLISRERGEAPLFVFVYTIANHFPWTNTFRPDLTPDWTAMNADPQVDEYVRRQSLSAKDYRSFVERLKQDFPDDSFLIVRFGDHPPAFASRVIEPGLSDTEIARRVMNLDPRYYTAYYAIDAVNFEPVDLTSARDKLDAPYLPIVVQEAAGLPLDSSFAEQKTILHRCRGLFYLCQDGAEARRFNRMLVESGLIKGL